MHLGSPFLDLWFLKRRPFFYDLVNRSLRFLIYWKVLLNIDASVTGIMLMSPLPGELASKERGIRDHINPQKDVECLTSANLDRLRAGQTIIKPPLAETFFRAVSLLDEEQHDVIRALRSMGCERVLVVTEGRLLGDELFINPLTIMLRRMDIEPETIRCSCLEDDYAQLRSCTQDADLVITACGLAPDGFIRADDVKQGAFLVDGGLPPDLFYSEALLAKIGRFISGIKGIAYLSKVITAMNVLLAWSIQHGCEREVLQALA
jgi:5,10-methylene-tetrahydrofolate dehydrogenase/methenyl tetrahydrofolate cyclohydrolase